MKNAFIATVMTITVLFTNASDCNASKKCKKSEVKARRGFGLYLGVTPFYEISPRTSRFSPHLMLHGHAGRHHPHYHHRGNVILPSRGRGRGIGLGVRYGIFRSRNLGFGIHIR